jgi:periplasmic mercuric ion binding protein
MLICNSYIILIISNYFTLLSFSKMKTVKLFLAIVLLGTFGMTISAQTANNSASQQKTETFKVWGKCDMCKARIEKAVKAEGVTSANWDKNTLLLTVIFDPAKTNIDALGKKLASVGHDTEKYKAPDDVYAKLPSCCHYDRAK